jgi:hypothetical protein
MPLHQSAVIAGATGMTEVAGTETIAMLSPVKTCRDSTNWGDDRGLLLVSHFVLPGALRRYATRPAESIPPSAYTRHIS